MARLQIPRGSQPARMGSALAAPQVHLLFHYAIPTLVQQPHNRPPPLGPLQNKFQLLLHRNRSLRVTSRQAQKVKLQGMCCSICRVFLLTKHSLLAALNDDTDLTIKLDNHTWRVHSNLMMAYSPFFEVLCNGQWKESKDRVVELHGDVPYVFARFIQFVYCQDYDGNTFGDLSEDIKLYVTIEKLLGTKRPQGCSGSDQAGQRNEAFLLEHFEVYELADKYGCTDLQVFARENIAKFCGRHLIGELDEMLNHHDLSGWRQVIEKDEMLKEIFAQIFAYNYRRMRNVVEEEYPSVREWLQWLEEDKTFCLMVMDAMSKKF